MQFDRILFRRGPLVLIKPAEVPFPRCSPVAGRNCCNLENARYSLQVPAPPTSQVPELSSPSHLTPALTTSKPR